MLSDFYFYFVGLGGLHLHGYMIMINTYHIHTAHMFNLVPRGIQTWFWAGLLSLKTARLPLEPLSHHCWVLCNLIMVSNMATQMSVIKILLACKILFRILCKFFELWYNFCLPDVDRPKSFVQWFLFWFWSSKQQRFHDQTEKNNVNLIFSFNSNMLYGCWT